MFRRLTFGPRRPGWSIPAEFVQVSVRTALVCAKRWGFPWLRDLQKLASPRPSLPLFGRVEFAAVDADGIPCEWCRPKDTTPGRTLLYLHGGGYVIGSVDSYRELIARLALGAGAQVLAPEYRLAPEHRFPSANDDCLAVYRWLLAQGLPAEEIAIAGDSAGGGLCVDVLRSARDAGDPLPAAALLFSPWVDPLARGGSLIENAPFDTLEAGFLAQCITSYLGGSGGDSGGADSRDLRVAPLHADLSGLPPIRIAVGTCEIFLDQARELAKRASQSGVDATIAEYEDCYHLFQNLAALIPTAEYAIADCCRFLEEKLSAAGKLSASHETPS